MVGNLTGEKDIGEGHGLGTPFHPHFFAQWPRQIRIVQWALGVVEGSVSPPTTPERHKRTGPGAAVTHTLPAALEAHTPVSGGQREQQVSVSQA